jgi:hypothetical protein
VGSCEEVINRYGSLPDPNIDASENHSGILCGAIFYKNIWLLQKECGTHD